MRKIFNKFIDDNILRKKKFVFISPHLDDAILSAGDLLYYLSQKKANVRIVNVFTMGEGGMYTISAKRHLAKCGFNNAIDLYKERIDEDGRVFDYLGFEVINLGFTDALYRKKRNVRPFVYLNIPELCHLYPFKVVGVGVSKGDEVLENELGECIRKLDLEECVVLCPIGFGGHVDHILTREACTKMFSHAIYWRDISYSGKNGELTEFTKRVGIKRKVFIKNTQKKIELIKYYRTQVKEMFKKEGIVLSPEVYYLKI